MTIDRTIYFSALVFTNALAAVGCTAPHAALPAPSTAEPPTVVTVATVVPAATPSPMTTPLTARHQAGDPAPELDSPTWINSPPLRMANLRGKVVIIDFWTFGCINCINTFPALQALHDRYKETDVVLISVHSPEFDREKDIDAVRAATARYKITYPVAVDNDLAIFRAYNIRYWPALYLVDKHGLIRDHHAGELHIGLHSWNAWLARIEALRGEA